MLLFICQVQNHRILPVRLDGFLPENVSDIFLNHFLTDSRDNFGIPKGITTLPSNFLTILGAINNCA